MTLVFPTHAFTIRTCLLHTHTFVILFCHCLSQIAFCDVRVHNFPFSAVTFSTYGSRHVLIITHTLSTLFLLSYRPLHFLTLRTTNMSLRLIRSQVTSLNARLALFLDDLVSCLKFKFRPSHIRPSTRRSYSASHSV